jgi:hypothetical protein
MRMKYHIYASQGGDDALTHEELEDEESAREMVDDLQEDGYSIDDVYVIDESSPEVQRQGWRNL